jgi:hypothetical protein
MDDVRVRTSELIAEARENIPRDLSDWANLSMRLASRLETILEMSPPDGWFMTGSHVGFDGPLEFSDTLDGDGLPRWERHPE